MNKTDDLLTPILQSRLTKFGQRLEIQRKNFGYTQKELAEVCGISQRVQSGYELGKVAPKLSYIYSLDAIGFDVQGLIFAGEHKGIYVLTSQEQTVMDLYRQSDAETKLRVLEMLAGRAIREQISDKASGDADCYSNSAQIAGSQNIAVQKKRS